MSDYDQPTVPPAADPEPIPGDIVIRNAHISWDRAAIYERLVSQVSSMLADWEDSGELYGDFARRLIETISRSKSPSTSPSYPGTPETLNNGQAPRRD